MPPSSEGKIRWQDALATNVMLVDFHLSHVRKMLQLDQVRQTDKQTYRHFYKQADKLSFA